MKKFFTQLSKIDLKKISPKNIFQSLQYLNFGQYAKIASKVTIVVLAGILTIYTIHSAVEKAFEKITGNIDELARPNERLIAVNHLFRGVLKLNNILQEETASGRKTLSLSYFDMSDSIFNDIDSLRVLFADDTLQIQRVHQIEEKLLSREKLLVDYLEAQHQYGADPGLSNLFQQLNTKAKPVVENVVDSIPEQPTVEEEKPEEKKRRGLFRRIFTRDKSDDEVADEDVVEPFPVDSVQTEETAPAKDVMAEFEKSIATISAKRQQLSAVLQRQQLELVNTNSFLVQEIISIINQVEQEELARQHAETRESFITAGKAIRQLNLIAVIFISASILFFILIIVDLSKSNRYRRELELANQRALDEAAAKQHFLSNMSHEIRTPLQSIFGYAEQAQLDPDSEINISAIYNSASHLLDVVNQVLNYSMVVSGKITFERLPFFPIEEINTVMEAMQPLAEKKDIKLNFVNLLSPKLYLIGDSLRLRQVLFNILGNAVKFTEVGSVTIQADYQAGYLVLVVMDTGIGIAEEHLSKLFQQYTQTDPSISSKYGGTGLGLSIAKEMVELQGGAIEVSSEFGKGTTFTIKVPYDETTQASEVDDEMGEQNHQFYEAYFADDDLLILSLCSAILTKQQIPHKTFEQGQNLINQFKKHPVPVVFLDMRMPDMDGSEICRELRAICPKDFQLTIYALTAQVLMHEREAILANGFDALVEKPFKESDLLEKLRIEEESVDMAETSVEINIEALSKIVGDDTEMLQVILTSIIEETQKDIIELEQAIKEVNSDTTALIVHRLAGRVSQTGASQLSMQLRDVEVALKQGSPLNGVNKELNNLLELITIFVEKVEQIKVENQ